MRKTLGGSARQLFLRFVGETAMLTLLAMALSFFLTYLASQYFAVFLPEGMGEHFHFGQMVLFGVLLMILISLLSGLYPAYLASRIDAVSMLKGQTFKAAGPKSLSFRHGLIVFQFFVAQLFIIGAIVVKQQLHYSMNKDFGFDKDAIMTVDIPYGVISEPENKDKQFVLLNELRSIAALRGVSMGDRPMKEAGFAIMNQYSYRQDSVDLAQSLILKYVDSAYLDLYRMKLITGRNIRQTAEESEVILSEKALDGFGFANPEEAVGQALVSPYTGKSFPIVGVVEDFHQFGVQTDIRPTALLTDSEYLFTYNIKLPQQMKQWPEAIQAVEQAWNSVYHQTPFAYRFYDQHIEHIYEEEKNTQTLVSAATAVTIFISCLGLFGLVTLTATQRTKEIGVRKVLGASVSGIVAMLSKDFVKLVCLAIVIASPIAWWAMNQWLADFAYRIEIQWWMFALAGIAAVVVALLTVATQAIRAAMANPVDSLRDE